MTDALSLAEAIAIVSAQTGLADPHAALRSAMERGAFTCDYDRVAFDIEDIDRAELQRWIASLKQAAPPSRPRGTGMQGVDAPLVARMHHLIASKSASSPTAAAKAILKEDGKSYGASAESTVRRLVDRYKTEHGE